MSIQSRNVFASALVAVSLPLCIAACGGTNGPGGPDLDPTSQKNSNTPFFVMPATAADGSLLPAVNDPGPPNPLSNPCAQPAGISRVVILDDYEQGIAFKGYTYNDTTSELYPLALKDWQPAAALIPASWGLTPCTWLDAAHPGVPSTLAMHFGGTFTNFGAGYGTTISFHGLGDITATPLSLPFGPLGKQQDVNVGIPNGTDTIETATLESVDLSAFTGITFWARRGPYGEDGFRTGVLDQTTSDDFNKQLPPDQASCRTIYTLCSCQNAKPCTFWDPADTAHFKVPSVTQTQNSIEALAPEAPDNTYLAGTYCWDPAVDQWPDPDPTLRCGQTACNYRSDTPLPTLIDNPTTAERAAAWYTAPPATPDNPNPLPGVGSMTCSDETYVFQNSITPSGKFCYDPTKDAPPAETFDRCGDAFLGPQPVDTNWQHYFIAFADMRQGNFDKRSAGINTAVAESLVFAFPGGHLDVWLDDIGFYTKAE